MNVAAGSTRNYYMRLKAMAIASMAVRSVIGITVLGLVPLLIDGLCEPSESSFIHNIYKQIHIHIKDTCEYIYTCIIYMFIDMIMYIIRTNVHGERFNASQASLVNNDKWDFTPQKPYQYK